MYEPFLRGSVFLEAVRMLIPIVQTCQANGHDSIISVNNVPAFEEVPFPIIHITLM